MHKVVTEPLAEDLPVCKTAWSVHFHRVQSLHVGIVDGKPIVGRLGSHGDLVNFGNKGENLVVFLKGEGKERDLKIWAGKSESFDVIKRLVCEAEKAGIETVDFMVKAGDAIPYRSLRCYLSRRVLSDKTKSSDHLKVIVAADKVFFEEGNFVEKIPNEDLKKLLSICKGAADVSDEEITFVVQVQDEVSYGRFIEVWELFQRDVFEDRIILER